MENDILKHRKAVQENILKSFGAEVSEDMLEKAHNHGEVHSNGKWYWESSANGGKGDWRTIKGTVKTAANSKTDTDKDDKKNSNDFPDKIDFSAPTSEDASKIQKWLENNELMPKSFWNVPDERWSVQLRTDSDGNKYLALGFTFTKNIPFKGKKQIVGTVLQFFGRNEVLAADRGSVLYPDEKIYKKIINPITKKMGLKYEKNGEFKGSSSKTDDDKKKSEKSSYESEKADAYDKGDGKVGNYSVPTHTSYPAANLYSRLNNNRHFGFKHGLPVKEIMEKLKDYKGNVNVSYHNNAGTSEIYRIKFL